MKTIQQGSFEILTTKEDAIDKLMQMQGCCREKISGDSPIQFYCSKKGSIIISHPPSRKRVRSGNSTNLYAEVIEKDNKTYITYYTAFSQSNHILKWTILTADMILAVLAIVISDKTIPAILLFSCFLLLSVKLLTVAKEKDNSPQDSEILIKELENRIDAVNQWDR